MKTTNFLFATLLTLSITAFAGKGDMAGAPKPYPSFGQENLQAIAKNSQVRRLLEPNRSILQIELVGRTAGKFYYSVKTNDSCTFTVLVENDHRTMTKDVVAKVVRADASCQQKTNRTGKVGEQTQQSLSEIYSLADSDVTWKALKFEYSVDGLQLKARKGTSSTYRVRSSNVLQNRQCTFDVNFEGGKAISSVVVEGCKPQVDDPALLTNVRLDCSFTQSAVAADLKGDRQYLTNDLGLEFQEVPGTDQMKCVVGCENPAWKYKSRTHPSMSMFLAGSPEVPMPRIRFEKADRSLTLKFEMYAGLQSATGEKVLAMQGTVLPIDNNGMIYAEVKREVKLDAATGFEFQRAGAEIRCELIKPGVRSEAQDSAVKNRPAAAGKIRLTDYESSLVTNVIRNDKGLFSETLKLAQQIDPTQISAGLPEDRFTEGLKKFAPRLKEELLANPNATNEQVWSYTEASLKTMGYPTAGLISFYRIALVLL